VIATLKRTANSPPPPDVDDENLRERPARTGGRGQEELDAAQTPLTRRGSGSSEVTKRPGRGRQASVFGTFIDHYAKASAAHRPVWVIARATHAEHSNTNMGSTHLDEGANLESADRTMDAATSRRAEVERSSCDETSGGDYWPRAPSARRALAASDELSGAGGGHHRDSRVSSGVLRSHRDRNRLGTAVESGAELVGRWSSTTTFARAALEALRREQERDSSCRSPRGHRAPDTPPGCEALRPLVHARRKAPAHVTRVLDALFLARLHRE